MAQFQTITIERAHKALFFGLVHERRKIDGALHSLLDIVEKQEVGAEQARNLLFRARKAGKVRGARLTARFAELMTTTVVTDLAARRAKQARQKPNQRTRSAEQAEAARQRNGGKKKTA